MSADKKSSSGLPALIAIGGSAGSFITIKNLAQQLPKNFPVPVMVVIHRMKISGGGKTAEILQYSSEVTVVEPQDKTQAEPGSLYIAPADYHVLVDENLLIHMDCSAPLNYSRPSIDIFFESVAMNLGTSATAVLLSGANADGAEGLKKIKEAGGKTLVENPESAEFNAMPLAATKVFEPDQILDRNELIEFILTIGNG